jgi:hypothetical protein
MLLVSPSSTYKLGFTYAAHPETATILRSTAINRRIRPNENKIRYGYWQRALICGGSNLVIEKVNMNRVAVTCIAWLGLTGGLVPSVDQTDYFIKNKGQQLVGADDEGTRYKRCKNLLPEAESVGMCIKPIKLLCLRRQKCLLAAAVIDRCTPLPPDDENGHQC